MPMADSTTTLHPLVAAIAKSFSLEDGVLVMNVEQANKHMAALVALLPSEREPVATHIVALAQRFRAEGGRSVDAALTLLIAFTVAAIGDPIGGAQKASDMFGRAGLAVDAANAAVGRTDPIKAPRADDVKRPEPVIKARRGLKRD